MTSREPVGSAGLESRGGEIVLIIDPGSRMVVEVGGRIVVWGEMRHLWLGLGISRAFGTQMGWFGRVPNVETLG